MNVATGLESFRPTGRPVSLALGTFDGLHKGHRAVIDTLRKLAEGDKGEAVITTFDPHPLTVVAPPSEPFLLTTLEERTELLEATGIDTLIVVRFDQSLRMIAAQDWLERIDQHLHPRRIVISSTHAFGHNRGGDPSVLRGWATARGTDVTTVPALTDDGVVVSSTAVRARLRDGDVRGAARWLERWYAVRGTVIAGAGRGRQLGVPTANLAVPPEKLVPAHGVYAAYATVDRTTYAAAVNIGVRPTFGGNTPAIEAHLIDVAVEVYGQTMELVFVERLRPERRFPDASALRAQLTGDVASARRILAERQPEAV